MMTKPPSCPTNRTPIQIIGHENMFLFKRHLEIAMSVSNGGEFPDKRLQKEIGSDDRRAIAEVLNVLQDNGYVPLGFKNDGSILWGVRTKSDSTVLMEKGLSDLQGKNLDELRQIALFGWGKFMQHQETVTGNSKRVVQPVINRDRDGIPQHQ